MSPHRGHVPVLLTTVLEQLSLKQGEHVLDCTIGLGGHAQAFLETIGKQGYLVGLDADSDNLHEAEKNLNRYRSNAFLIHANFAAIPDCLPPDMRSFDVIFADLGLSSPHIDDPSRGFAFQHDAPLDMRFDRTRGQTAADLLNTASREELTALFQEFGELPKTHRFVRLIADVRKEHRIDTSGALTSIVQKIYGFDAKNMLPQIFQALRIAVNHELDALDHLLRHAPMMLAPHGRMAMISYHSLEDRLVKRAFKQLLSPEKDPLTGQTLKESTFEATVKKAITPAQEELENNPRARSAKLRIICKR